VIAEALPGGVASVSPVQHVSNKIWELPLNGGEWERVSSLLSRHRRDAHLSESEVEELLKQNSDQIRTSLINAEWQYALHPKRYWNSCSPTRNSCDSATRCCVTRNPDWKSAPFTTAAISFCFERDWWAPTNESGESKVDAAVNLLFLVPASTTMTLLEGSC
jgi:hypothetical protein